MQRISKRIYYGWIIVAVSGGMEFANAATAIGILTIFVNPSLKSLAGAGPKSPP